MATAAALALKAKNYRRVKSIDDVAVLKPLLDQFEVLADQAASVGGISITINADRQAAIYKACISRQGLRWFRNNGYRVDIVADSVIVWWDVPATIQAEDSEA